MSPGCLLLDHLAHPQAFGGPKVVKRSAYKNIAVQVIRRPVGPSTYLPPLGTAFQTVQSATGLPEAVRRLSYQPGLSASGRDPRHQQLHGPLQALACEAFAGVSPAWAAIVSGTGCAVSRAPRGGLSPPFNMTRTLGHCLPVSASCSHSFLHQLLPPRSWERCCP
jgi:hypothetical protein